MSETPGMAQHEVTRTLVKSQPELWTQCSDADSLGRHLSGSFGEIRITRLEPEHSVAWEGEEVSGTVRIEPSAWGTRVTLAVEMADEVAGLEQIAQAAPTEEWEPEPIPEPELHPDPPPAAPSVNSAAPTLESEARPGVWARLLARWRRPPTAEPPAEPEPPLDEASAREPAAEEPPVAPEPPAQEPAPDTEPAAFEPAAETASRPDTAAALTAALDSLGQAHHRPFSRA